MMLVMAMVIVAGVRLVSMIPFRVAIGRKLGNGIAHSFLKWTVAETTGIKTGCGPRAGAAERSQTAPGQPGI